MCKRYYRNSSWLLLTLLLVLIPGLPAHAQRNTDLPHLMQATDAQAEFLGKAHLGLLATKEDLSGDRSAAARNVMPAVAQIRVGSHWGSGCILEMGDDCVYLASNRHLLQYQSYSIVSFSNGKKASGQVLWLSPDLDLGFLKADVSGWSYKDREALRQIRMDENCIQNLTKGTPIFMIGSSDGVACNISTGSVQDPWYYFDEFGSYMLYNYCSAKPGMSGGGTFDEHGHFIGMITGGRGTETASLPARLIWEEWNRYDKN